jgi:hypothetical protein
MTAEELIGRCPMLYHATREANLPSIVARKSLLSPDETNRLAGRVPTHTPRRSGAGDSRNKPVKFPFMLPNGTVYLSDHDRLHDGHILFEPEWDLRRFITLLDSLVFFWPEGDSGPSDQGHDHFKRYAKASERMLVLAVPLGDVIKENGAPQISSCNSGAPRSNPISGKQPRGAATFREIGDLSSRDDIVEVVFRSQVRLPESTRCAADYDGPWKPLF